LGNNDGIIILGALGLFYLVTKGGKAKESLQGSTYIYSYSNYVESKQQLGEGDKAPSSKSSTGFKTPAQALTQAPSGAGVVLHGTGTTRSGGGYQIR